MKKKFINLNRIKIGMSIVLSTLLIAQNVQGIAFNHDSLRASFSKPENCEFALSNSPEIQTAASVYRPIGFVSSSLIDKFTREHPMLFTPLYFQMLGMALYSEGLTDLVNKRGQFHESIPEEEKKRALSIAGGKGKESVQIQGRMATKIWESIEEAFRLKDPQYDESRATQYTKDALYTDVDSFRATRDYLLENLSQRKQVIEFVRLSLPFGIKMAIDGLTRNQKKAIFLTGITAAGVFSLSYIVNKLMLMVGNPDPSLSSSLIVPILSTLSSSFVIYVYNAPRSQLQKLHLWMMNRHNRRILKQQGLIHKDDGESSLFIDSQFEDLDQLQTDVEVADIEGLVPELPTSTETTEIKEKMFTYGNKLQEMLASVSNFQSLVMQKWGEYTKSMGEPFYALGRLLKVDQDKAKTSLPDNMHKAIVRYREEMNQVFPKLLEMEREFTALVKQFEAHESHLTKILERQGSRLESTAADALREKKLTMAQGKETARLMIEVVKKHQKSLTEEQRSLGVALDGMAKANALQSMNESEKKALSDAIWNLIEMVEKSDVDSEMSTDDKPEEPSTDVANGTSMKGADRTW